jgi:hypothetical protein
MWSSGMYGQATPYLVIFVVPLTQVQKLQHGFLSFLQTDCALSASFGQATGSVLLLQCRKAVLLVQEKT